MPHRPHENSYSVSAVTPAGRFTMAEMLKAWHDRDKKEGELPEQYD